MRYTGNKVIEEDMQGKATMMPAKIQINNKKLYIETGFFRLGNHEGSD